MSEQSHILIDLRRLPVGTHHFDYQLDNEFFASLEKSEILSGQVAAEATLNLREDDYTLTISVHGIVSVVCDRCLEPMNIEINDEQEIFSAEEEEDPMVNGTYPNGKYLDLSWLAYEIVSVNIPLVHSHQPGECNPQMELLLHSHLCDEPEPEIDTDSDIE